MKQQVKNLKLFEIEQRVIEEATYMILTKDTIRGTAEVYHTSKSVVHKDLTERLFKLNPVLAWQVRAVLELNKEERAVRGGRALQYKLRMKGKDIAD